MAFQPIVDLDTHSIDSYEALVRGVNGEGAAQMLAQLTPATLYAFDQACRVRAIELAAKLGIACRLNINFLPNAVYEPRACLRQTLDAATRSNFPTSRLTFEIMESENMTNPEHLLKIVAEYRRQGFLIALDDFGTGHSSLSRLLDLRPDIIKVDRALVRDCDQDPFRIAILDNILQLGRATGVKVVLEGMERAGEVAALRAIGGRFMQGYYFARPSFEAIVTATQIFGDEIGPAA